MNKETIINSIKNIPSGYILDIDIDHFDQINKNYGHDTGDRVLFEVPERAKAVLKSHGLDVDVIRIDGDEFIVILKEKPIDFVKSISSEIIYAMDRELNFDGTIVKFSISIGISEFSLNSSDEVVKNAQSAMLKAKENGRNQYSLA
jgi:AraC family transcriptional regulator